MKLIYKLREFHFFSLSLIALWNLFFLFGTILVDWDKNIYLQNLPKSLFFFIGLIWMIIGVSLMFYYLKNITNKKTFLFAFLWNFILPIALAIATFCVPTDFYDYSGEFLGGLGAFITGLAVIILSTLGGGIFLILTVIKRKRIQKQKPKQAFWVVLGDILSVIALIALFCFRKWI